MLTLLTDQENQILEYCRVNSEIEVCGILVGYTAIVKKVFFIKNKYASPTRFFMEPTELLQAFNWMDQHEMELLGIFHSHPNGPKTPSITDIQEFYYPGIESIIVTPTNGKWKLFPYVIENKSYKLSKIFLI